MVWGDSHPLGSSESNSRIGVATHTGRRTSNKWQQLEQGEGWPIPQWRRFEDIQNTKQNIRNQDARMQANRRVFPQSCISRPSGLQKPSAPCPRYGLTPGTSEVTPGCGRSLFYAKANQSPGRNVKSRHHKYLRLVKAQFLRRTWGLKLRKNSSASEKCLTSCSATSCLSQQESQSNGNATADHIKV